jgi:sugar/nucleoside kinase (ribokinase family)
VSKPVLCAGRFYCDLVFADAPRLPTFGTEVFAPSLSLHAGGGAFITAANLAALGHRVTQFSCLPATPFDTTALTEMARHGVDATACQRAIAGVDPQITVAIASEGDRAFITRNAGPAIPELGSVNLADYSHLHIGELRTLQDHPGLLTAARTAGITVSLDCAWQDEFDPDVADLIAKVDVFLPNESEAAALSAIGIPQACAPLTVIKCGEDGSRVHDGNGWVHAAITKPVTVLDATGAGDAFNAGFLTCWLEGAPLQDCLAKGNACGAAAVQFIGGAGCLQPGLGSDLKQAKSHHVLSSGSSGRSTRH